MTRHNAELTISVIIPTLNEELALAETLASIARVEQVTEVIVSDGGSTDATESIARRHCCRFITGAPGRGAQLHTGARAARADIFWFVHADTRPPADAGSRMIASLAGPEVVGGHFRVAFDGTQRSARLFAWIYRCAQQCGLCYGDSAFFVRRETYWAANGFRPIPLFEDLDLRKRLLKLGRFVSLPITVTTSARRFAGRSAALLLSRWIVLQVLYWLGVPTHRLANFYAAIRAPAAPRRKPTTRSSSGRHEHKPTMS